MKKDEIFFGATGLTLTSANYTANMAKNLYMQIEKELNSIKFYDKEMSLIGSNVRDVISTGVRSIDDIQDKLERVAKLKSLIAWLREAISAKERLLSEANRFSFDDFGIEYPEMPGKPVYLTADDIVGTWNVKQRNRYYYLETLCAQIGKYIHPDGPFATARENMYNVINDPREVVGNGRDTIVYHYNACVDPEDVEAKYMELQNLYRSYQAELNSMKHEVEMVLQEDKRIKDLAYNDECQKYHAEIMEAQSRLTSLKNDAIATVQALKIVIPDSLKPIYEEVSALGKKQS